MNPNYIPIIALVFLLPLFISPFTIQASEGVDISTKTFSSEGTLNVLVEFEYPKSLAGLKTDIDNNLVADFTQIQLDFKNNGNYTNYQSSLTPTDDMLFDLGIINGERHYQLSPELSFSGNSSTPEGIETEYDIQVSVLRESIIDFLVSNNGTHVASWINYSFGELELNEQF